MGCDQFIEFRVGNIYVMNLFHHFPLCRVPARRVQQRRIEERGDGSSLGRNFMTRALHRRAKFDRGQFEPW